MTMEQASGSLLSLIAAIIAAAATIVAAGIVAWVTRRGAKESAARTDSVSAGQLYGQLTGDQRQMIDDLRTRLRRRDELARQHTAWDRELVAQINNLDGLNIPPPPPLVED